MEKKKPMQLYRKLFWTYTVIVLCIVAALVAYFISASRRRVLLTNESELDWACAEAVDYVEEMIQRADYLYQDLYRSSSELDDLLAYFSLDPESYQNFSLDRYSASKSYAYKGIHNMVGEAFQAYRELEKVELLAYSDMELTECYPQNIFHPGKDGGMRRQQIDQGQYGEEGKITVVREINDPSSMNQVGNIIFTFEGKDAFEELEQSVDYGNLAVTLNYDTAVYQSAGEDLMEVIKDDAYYVLRENAQEYQIYAFLERDKAAGLSLPTLSAILGAGVLAAVIGIVCIGYYVRRLTGRVDLILGAMNQVTTGDLSVRLKYQKRGDELDMISENFNEMCSRLQLYIQKSYLAEIERKNAQMQALQSQINPHFLYNTLEAIRMKAICNGDREVGKMLYSMVTLFRSQLKEADVITLGQELDYCKQYLELFEYRYQGQFQSQVECPVELLGIPIIKFVLQPIIENYFVHGIDRTRQDNRVTIRARRQQDRLELYVQDNGVGMKAEDMEKKNQELRENREEQTEKKSIGISNVNRRIKAVYGEEYGISIEAAKPEGLLVKVTIKIEEGKAHEEGHVS